MSRFTVLGGSGFIGRHLVAHLRGAGHEVWAPARGEAICARPLGHVIYAIGLTGDFRQRPFDTVEAHVGLLGRVLREAEFDSFLYLSSTRVYGGLPADTLASEELALPQRPTLDGLYDLSKLLGEALCLALPNPAIRVVRLSNVYGLGQSRHTFLQMLLDSLAQDGAVEIGEAPESSKDYVALADVLELLPRIALQGRERLYNLAGGEAISHRQLADCLQAAGAGRVRFAAAGATRRFPHIDISRLQREFAWQPRRLVEQLPALIEPSGRSAHSSIENHKESL
ncbi:MAG: NAD-dependent epimerase/dehydratase family protein [Pseudomonas sp.]